MAFLGGLTAAGWATSATTPAQVVPSTTNWLARGATQPAPHLPHFPPSARLRYPLDPGQARIAPRAPPGGMQVQCGTNGGASAPAIVLDYGVNVTTATSFSPISTAVPITANGRSGEARARELLSLPLRARRHAPPPGLACPSSQHVASSVELSLHGLACPPLLQQSAAGFAELILWNRALAYEELYNASSFLMAKYCVSAPTFSATPPPAATLVASGVTPTNLFAPSGAAPAVADYGSAGQSAVLYNGAQVAPQGFYFPASGNPYVQLPSYQFGGGDFTIGAGPQAPRGTRASPIRPSEPRGCPRFGRRLRCEL